MGCLSHSLPKVNDGVDNTLTPLSHEGEFNINDITLTPPKVAGAGGLDIILGLRPLPKLKVVTFKKKQLI